MDLVGKDVAGNGGVGVDEERIAVHDLEQPFRHQEQPPAAEHVSRRLAIGHLIREVVVEVVSSFIVVFWSCVAALLQEMHGTLSFPLVCLAVALVVAFVLGWIGPAHLNPAVTVTFAAFGYFPWPKLPLYALAQLAGSVLACLSVNGVMQPREDHFYGTAPMVPGHTRLPFLLEFLASAVLMVVISNVARSSASKAVGGLAIGAAVGSLGLVISPVSGGSMNPVRTLGPALVLGRYDSLWIYLVAPVSGMLLGALCNRLARSADAIVAFLFAGDALAAKRALVESQN
ncbi:hypothetical protein PR202_gb26668 [Eleusine coracana subsp. coracana]|uniref:Uncharacterized protein n=1 Tax=Eleusine coracana subsp. coracana TaxID=191504 RepID=A0AAV5FSE5_ELECO|nr:hypothetical protein QOZ80_1BG0055730 [Eleusine coracana subsp. coracana]GJN37687.1 hypothetical protein PR202_gb26668 [Eleusine coracana subsp. coracana]